LSRETWGRVKGEIPGSPFFIEMNFVKALSEKSKEDWDTLYKKYKHKEWRPPEEDKRGIRLEAKIEDVEEIGRIMRKPGRGAWHE